MNYLLVLRQLGMMVGIVVVSLLAAMLFESLHWDVLTETDHIALRALLVSAAIGGLIAGACWLVGRQGRFDYFGRREALLLVAAGWVVGTIVASLPFFLWYHLGGASHIEGHPFSSWIDCYFESVSGLTTTGASILVDIESVPRSLLFWRAMTQWLGALGIVVLFVAVLPTLGTESKRMFRAETAGPQQEGVKPRIREVARVLWLIYLGFSIVLLVALRLAGMNWYDAICHTFTTISTGGYSTYNASIAAFDSVNVEMIILLFMFLGAINFGVYYTIVHGQFRHAIRDPQMRCYALLCIVGSLIVAYPLWGTTIQTSAGEWVEVGLFGALRYASFNYVSLSSSTGFCTADYDQWGFFSKSIMMIGMYINGCTGSTASGMKVLRFLILFAIIAAEIHRAYRPSLVCTVRVGNIVITSEQRQAVLLYVVLMSLFILFGAIAVRTIEPAEQISLASAMSSSLACFANTGPGLGLVGPTEGYAVLTSSSKFFLTMLMLLGRLEIFAIVVLFMPSFWRRD